MRRLLCMLLTALLLVSAMPVYASAEGTDTIDVSTAQELSAACARINNNGGTYIINLTADISGSIDISKSGAVVTVIGNGHTISATRNTVNVSGGATVNLGDGSSELTIKSDNEPYEDPGLVYIMDNSVCNMYDKVTLKDRKANNQLGGGVTVQGGTFHMYGGTIQNCGIEGGSVCYGGGVAVFNGGYFEMNGGTIKDCYVTGVGSNNGWQIPYVAGGGVFVNCASFVMNNGLIDGCTATNPEDAQYFDAVGGGIAVITSLESIYNYGNYGYLDSDFTMNRGTIKDCSATVKGGALAAGMAYANYEPMLTHSYVPKSGSSKPGIFLNGGSMIGNDAYEGGAIFLNWLRSDISVNINNMSISSNSAYNGAGIEIYSYWTQANIDGCTITNNEAENRGGGVMAVSNSSGGYTSIKNTDITNNKSNNRGAGVYYDKNSVIRISGVNEIQNNTYNEKQNNLNILSKSKPVYVNGDLTGSQIGLSDPKLWDDGKEDTDDTAVSEDYLTSGYKTYNSANPDTVFTSDHESWYADFSDVNDNEVRLVQSLTVDFHINNDAIASESYDDNDLFTQYVNNLVHTVKVGDTIQEFYLIPTHDTSYIFKGWYYDRANDNDTHPVKFGTDKYTAGKDIYAHWIKIEDVEKDENDTNVLPDEDGNKYGGFDLSGVQVRKGILDSNFGYENKPGGLRFLTSLSMDVVDQINAIKPNNIEYGYVASTNGQWINYHEKNGRKLLYNSSSANGIDTTDSSIPESFFGFAKNINCTSKRASSTGVVKEDHRNFDKYLLYTLVITYENADENGYDKNVLARPYIKYTDANGLERVSYSEYRGGSNTLGGCYTSYNANKVQ